MFEIFDSYLSFQFLLYNLWTCIGLRWE